jgi:hypothetical protein
MGTVFTGVGSTWFGCTVAVRIHWFSSDCVRHSCVLMIAQEQLNSSLGTFLYLGLEKVLSGLVVLVY